MRRQAHTSSVARLVIIVAVTFALYGRTAGFGFSYLDDDVLIVDQQSFLAQPSSLWRAFGRPYFPPAGRDHAYYRPAVSASYALDARVSGNSPSGFHLTNVALHALAAALLFLLLRRLGHGDGVALFGGLVYAVHPALTETVAWIPGRSDGLLAVFALASWLLFLRSWQPRSWGSRAGHLLTLLAALLSKESAVVLPVVYLGHLVLVERRPWRSLLAPWLLAGWAAVLGVAAAARAAVLADTAGTAGLSVASFFRNGSLFPISLGKLVLPVHLSVLATPEDSWLWPGALAIAVIVAALFALPTRRAPMLFALACFVAFVAPALPASGQLVLESRLTLPAVAIVLLASAVADRVGGSPRALLAAGGTIVAVLAAASFSYSNGFRDRMTFCQAAVRGSPHSALAHRNLGVAHQIAGDADAARREYEAALGQDAAEPIVHNNLAVLLMAKGQLPEAERLLREELAINPSYATAQRNLALVLRALGRPAEAAP